MSFEKNNITGKLAAIKSFEGGAGALQENKLQADERLTSNSRDPFNFILNVGKFLEGESVIEDAFDEITTQTINEGEPELKQALKDLVDNELIDNTTPANTINNNISNNIDANYFNSDNFLKENQNELNNNLCKKNLILGSSIVLINLILLFRLTKTLIWFTTKLLKVLILQQIQQKILKHS